MTYYEAMLQRKSVREYEMNPLDKELLAEMAEQIKELDRLYPENGVRVELVSQIRYKVGKPIQAPHYLTIFAEEKDGWLENAGFMVEQLLFWMVTKGLGSCWLGLADWPGVAGGGYKFVIAIAFGVPVGEGLRTDLSGLKRKTMEEIVPDGACWGKEQILEAARIAPSGVNFQPWRFVVAEDVIHIYRQEPKKVIRSVKSLGNMLVPMQRIDCGIAMAHLHVAAQNFGYKTRFEKDPLPPALEGCAYTMSMYLTK